MSLGSLSSRAIIGTFYEVLEVTAADSWVNPLSMLFESNQESETYKWLGMSPVMREWIGGRLAKGLRDNGVTIANKKFEATLEIPVDWMRRDKTGQILIRINEMAKRANNHWAQLLSTLILNGASQLCYDGQYYFDTDHSEGDSGVQSNSISYDVVTPTAPTSSEMQSAILTAVQQMYALFDDPCAIPASRRRSVGHHRTGQYFKPDSGRRFVGRFWRKTGG